MFAREVDRGVERWPVWTELKPTADFIERVKTSEAGSGLSQVGGLRCGRVPQEPVNEVLDAVVRFDTWSHSRDGILRRNREKSVRLGHDGLEDRAVLLYQGA